MAIAALAMVIAAPPVTNMLDKISFRNEVNEMTARLRGWKLMAVRNGKPVSITLEEDVLLVQLSMEEAQEKPIADDMTLIMEPQRVIFSPEGWATPATIEISIGKRSRKIEINPLTGLPRKI